MFKKTLCQVSEKDGPGGLRGELPQRGRLHENGVQRPGYGSGKRALFLIRRFLKGPAYRGHAVCFDENAVSRSGFGGMLYGRIPPHIRADGDVAAKADIVLQAVLTGIPVDEIGVGIFQENARDPRLLTLGMEDDRPAKRCGERELPPEYTLLDGEGDAAPDAVHADFTDHRAGAKKAFHIGNRILIRVPRVQPGCGYKTGGTAVSISL